MLMACRKYHIMPAVKMMPCKASSSKLIRRLGNESRFLLGLTPSNDIAVETEGGSARRNATHGFTLLAQHGRSKPQRVHVPDRGYRSTRAPDPEQRNVAWKRGVTGLWRRRGDKAHRVHGAADDAPQRVPGLVIEPIPQVVKPLLRR